MAEFLLMPGEEEEVCRASSAFDLSLELIDTASRNNSIIFERMVNFKLAKALERPVWSQVTETDSCQRTETKLMWFLAFILFLLAHSAQCGSRSNQPLVTTCSINAWHMYQCSIHGLDYQYSSERRNLVFGPARTHTLHAAWRRRGVFARLKQHIIKTTTSIMRYVWRARPSPLALRSAETASALHEEKVEIENQEMPHEPPDQTSPEPDLDTCRKETEETVKAEAPSSDLVLCLMLFMASTLLLSLISLGFTLNRSRSQSRYLGEIEMKLFIVEDALMDEKKKVQLKDSEAKRREAEAAEELKEWEGRVNKALEEAERERQLSESLSISFEKMARFHSIQIQTSKANLSGVRSRAIEGIEALSLTYKRNIEHLLSLASSQALSHLKELDLLQDQLDIAIREIKTQRDKRRMLESELCRREIEAEDHIRDLEDLSQRNNRASVLLSSKDDQIRHDRQLRDKLQINLQEAEEKVQDLSSELKAVKASLLIEVEASERTRDYIEILSRKKDELESEAAKIPSFEEKISQATERVKALMGRLVSGEQQVQSLQQEIRDKESEIKRIEQSLVRAREEAVEKEKKLEAGWQRKASEAQGMIEAKVKEVEARVQDIELLKEELGKCRAEISTLGQKNGAVRKPLVLANISNK